MRQRQMEAPIRKHQFPPRVVATGLNAHRHYTLALEGNAYKHLNIQVTGFVAYITANYASGTSMCLSKITLPV
jgi:hypothetical protein